MRIACQEIERVACEECGIAREDFRLVGPPADNVAIDIAGEHSFARLSALSALVGLVLAYLCYRSLRVTGVVIAVGALSACLSLAIVHYYGRGEMLLGGLSEPHYGKLDAVLMTMPAVVYVLGISGAIHVLNYYLDARRQGGPLGAVERAVRIGWAPCALAALTTAVGLAALSVSDIVPIKKFGAFTSVSVLAALAVLFSLLPVYLHVFPPPDRRRQPFQLIPSMLSKLAKSATEFVVRRHAWVTLAGFCVIAVTGWGLVYMESTERVLKLLDPDSKLISDYRWVEQHLANVVPMEVVLTVPAEKCRSGKEHAEFDGQQYRLTTLERMQLVRTIADRIENLSAVSRTMSAATFAPQLSRGRSDYVVNRSLEENLDSFGEYLRNEPAAVPDTRCIVPFATAFPKPNAVRHHVGQ